MFLVTNEYMGLCLYMTHSQQQGLTTTRTLTIEHDQNFQIRKDLKPKHRGLGG